ncbi:alginate lyase-domain-containing protein [Umbelopsis sp. AD052]|nr:alginate lyase-domain-containing protein [Umbelopsis sp. AD052]
MLAFTKTNRLLLAVIVVLCLLQVVFAQDGADTGVSTNDDVSTQQGNDSPVPGDNDIDDDEDTGSPAEAPSTQPVNNAPETPNDNDQAHNPAPDNTSPETPSQTKTTHPAARTTSVADKIGGWPYPIPEAKDATDDIQDGTFPFVRIHEKDLESNKQHMNEPDQALQNALWYLQTKARRYVTNTTVFSVVNKKINAPSNDSHDYMSLARYFWPDESVPGGLPYVRVDGHVNPEIRSVPDYAMLREMIKQVQFLSLAYYYFDNETYAEKATSHVKNWFLNKETRMNPHLQYASIIRGYDMGRAKGVIDFSVITDLLDSIAILQHSKAWGPRTSAGLRVWFTTYLDWLRNSPNGNFEKTAHNNHGTYYDVQQLAISYFLGQDKLAMEVAQNATANRIAQQILATGEQYFETDRPFSWFYSVYNLRGMFQLAELAEHVRVDLWNYRTVDGKSIKGALDFLLPGAVNNSQWQFKNTEGFAASSHLVELLQKAYIVYNASEYLALSRYVSNQQSQLYNVTRLTMPWESLNDGVVRKIHTEAQSSSTFLLPSTFLAASVSIVAMVVAPMFM